MATLKYRLEHKDQIKEYNKRHYREHKDYWKEFSKNRDKEFHNRLKREWWHKNKEHCKKLHKVWKLSNSNLLKVYDHNRRALTKNLTRKIVQQVYEDNIKRFGTLTCYLCLEPIEFGQDSLEHKIPLSRGGTNKYSNLGIAHRNCNSKKHKKTEKEYRSLIKLS